MAQPTPPVQKQPVPVAPQQPVDVETTDTSLRYAAYLARLRSLFMVKAAALSGAVRYTAYTSDVGEAFRPVVNVNIVRAAYAISWGYVGFDVFNEVQKDYKDGRDSVEMTRTAISRGVFQSLASMALPAFTIHQTVHLTHKIFHRMNKFTKWGPTVCGLAVVPALPYLFDHPVEYVVDKVFDTVWPSKYPRRHPHPAPHLPHIEHKKEEKHEKKD